MTVFPESLRNAAPCGDVESGMTTLSGIHAEIERLSEERAELWHRLSAEYDPQVKDEIRRLEDVITVASEAAVISSTGRNHAGRSRDGSHALMAEV